MTIGDAVMATFETPDRAIAAAIRMRKAMSDLQAERQHIRPAPEDGHPRRIMPCGHAQWPAGLFWPDHPDRVARQGLAASLSIMVGEQVVANARHARALLETNGLTPTLRRVALSGIMAKVSVYEID